MSLFGVRPASGGVLCLPGIEVNCGRFLACRSVFDRDGQDGVNSRCAPAVKGESGRKNSHAARCQAKVCEAYFATVRVGVLRVAAVVNEGEGAHLVDARRVSVVRVRVLGVVYYF